MFISQRGLADLRLSVFRSDIERFMAWHDAECARRAVKRGGILAVDRHAAYRLTVGVTQT
jgi:hypothetical protein